MGENECANNSKESNDNDKSQMHGSLIFCGHSTK